MSPSTALATPVAEAAAPVYCCEKDQLTRRAALGGPTNVQKLPITGETHLGILELSSLHDRAWREEITAIPLVLSFLPTTEPHHSLKLFKELLPLNEGEV